MRLMTVEAIDTALDLIVGEIDEKEFATAEVSKRDVT
jgi:hypothetical protein